MSQVGSQPVCFFWFFRYLKIFGASRRKILCCFIAVKISVIQILKPLYYAYLRDIYYVHTLPLTLAPQAKIFTIRNVFHHQKYLETQFYAAIQPRTLLLNKWVCCEIAEKVTTPKFPKTMNDFCSGKFLGKRQKF